MLPRGEEHDDTGTDEAQQHPPAPTPPALGRQCALGWVATVLRRHELALGANCQKQWETLIGSPIALPRLGNAAVSTCHASPPASFFQNASGCSNTATSTVMPRDPPARPEGLRLTRRYFLLYGIGALPEFAPPAFTEKVYVVPRSLQSGNMHIFTSALYLAARM